MKKILAVVLFLYAAWQIFTFANAPTQGQGVGQIIWALLAMAGGIYLLKRAKKK